MFCGKGVLKNFAKLTRKHHCQSLYFNKVAGLRLVTLLKRHFGTGVFCKFYEISNNIFSNKTPLVAASEISKEF